MEDVIVKINKDYQKRLKENQELLIEAFVKYYGENARYHITEVINNTNIFWFLPPDFIYIYQNVLANLGRKRIILTKKILQVLNPSLDMTIKGSFAFFKPYANGVGITGFIESALSKEEKDYLPLLKTLFGEKGYYDVDYKKKSPLANFHVLDKFQQQKMLQSLYGVDTLTDEVKKKIEAAQSLMEQFKEELLAEEKFLELNYLIDYFKKNDNFKNNLKSILRHKFPWQVLGCTKDEIYQAKLYKYVYNNIRLSMQDSYAFQQLISDGIHIVGIPLFLIQDQELIHELNHALRANIMALSEEGQPLVKNGLSTENYQDIFFEELFNDRSAKDIADIFHSLGGAIFPNAQDYGVEGMGGYYPFFPLIEEFYQYFKEDIKKASETDNLNALIQKVGKETYFEFKNYILAIGKTINLNQRTILMDPMEEEKIRTCQRYTEQMKENAQQIDNTDYLKDYTLIGQTPSGLKRVKEIK